MAENFVRHRQAWTHDETQKLKRLAEKGMGLKAIAKALTRSEVRPRKKLNKKSLKLKNYADRDLTALFVTSCQ